MRRLMWFSLGFTILCVVASVWTEAVWNFALLMGLLAAAVTSSLVGRHRESLRPIGVIFLGAFAAVLWFSCWYTLRIEPVKELDGQDLFLEITVSDFSQEREYGVYADGIITVSEQDYPVQVYFKEQLMLSPGDRVRGTFRLRTTLAEKDGDSFWHQGNGVFLTLRKQDTIEVATSGKIPVCCYPAFLRRHIRSTLDSAFPEDCRAFVKALLLGDAGDLDYKTETALKVSGIRHIIAVSGLHISILYAMVSALTLRRRFLTAAVGLPVLLVFAAVAGFTPSVTRACIMVWLMLLARVFEREYDSLTALAASVLLMLVVNPLAVTSVSLQLSAGCVTGIFLFEPRLRSWLLERFSKRKGIAGKLQHFLCSGISVSISAMSLVSPLCVWYFGSVSMIGVLTNLLTLWVVNLLFNSLVVICILHLFLPGMAALAAGCAAWLVRYVLKVAELLSAFPLAAVYFETGYMVIWMAFCYGLLLLLLLKKGGEAGMLLCCGAIGFCLAVLLSWTEPMTESVRITMLDVGQGQSILLQSEGKAYLVDCGGEDEARTADCIAAELFSQGIFHLDGILLTHFDDDHAGALKNLLTRVDTDLLILPDTRSDFIIPETNARIVYVWEDLELTFGSSAIRVFGPVYSGQDNENSLGILFDTEKCDILITGDRGGFGEGMLLRKYALPQVDVLVAGHHGAAESTTAALLQAVKPETVLISVGRDNYYGHPSPALLSRLEDYGCRVYRTDQHGTITIRR